MKRSGCCTARSAGARRGGSFFGGRSGPQNVQIIVLDPPSDSFWRRALLETSCFGTRPSCARAWRSTCSTMYQTHVRCRRQPFFTIGTSWCRFCTSSRNSYFTATFHPTSSPTGTFLKLPSVEFSVESPNPTCCVWFLPFCGMTRSWCSKPFHVSTDVSGSQKGRPLWASDCATTRSSAYSSSRNCRSLHRRVINTPVRAKCWTCPTCPTVCSLTRLWWQRSAASTEGTTHWPRKGCNAKWPSSRPTSPSLRSYLRVPPAPNWNPQCRSLSFS